VPNSAEKKENRMEIADYLRVARRRLWVLIAVPVIAGGIAAYLVLAAPATYTATSTVSAPALVGGSTTNQYTGAQAVNQFVAQFQATAQVPAVLDAVSKQTKVSRADLAAGLTVAQVGASSVMTMTFTTPKRGIAKPVLDALTRETLQTMFSSQVTLSQGQLAAATEAVKAGNAAIVAWEQQNNMVEPTRVYQASLDRINNLLQQASSLAASGNAAGAAAVNGSVAAAKQELVKFGPILAQYQQLTAQRDAAVNSVTLSQQQLSAARGQQSAADPSKVAFVSNEAPVDKKAALVTLLLPVIGAAVFVAVALVAMLELLSRSRAASAREKVGEGSPYREAAPHGPVAHANGVPVVARSHHAVSPEVQEERTPAAALPGASN